MAVIQVGLTVPQVKPHARGNEEAIYRHELDFDKLEQTIIKAFDEAIARRDENLYLGSWLDSSLRRRLWPHYAAVSLQMPDYEPLAKAVVSGYTDLDMADELLTYYTQRFDANSDDLDAARGILAQCSENEQHAMLVEEGSPLTEAVRRHVRMRHLLQRMVARFALGHDRAALDLSAQIEARLPDVKCRWRRLSEVYEDAGHPAKARAVFEKWAPRDSLESARTFARYGAVEEALECVDAWFDRDPSSEPSAEMLFKCVDVLRLLGQGQRAEEVFTRAEQAAVAAIKRQGYLHIDLFDRYEREGRLKRYLDVYIPLYEDSDAAWTFGGVIDRLVANKQPELALEYLAAYLPKYRTDSWYLLVYARKLRALEKYRRALDMYRQAEANCPKGAALDCDEQKFHRATEQVECLFALRAYDECERWVQQRAAISPEPEHVWHVLARAYNRIGEDDKALEYYRRAHDHGRVIRLLLKGGGAQEADLYVGTIADDKSRTYYQSQLRDARVTPARRAEMAVVEALRKVADEPASGWLQAKLGERLFSAGRITEGRNAFRQAVRLGYDFQLVPRFGARPLDSTYGGSGGMDMHQYYFVVCDYLEAGLRAELEADFSELIARGKRQRVEHLEDVASWYMTYSQRQRAIPIYRQLQELNPPKSDRYGWEIKRAEAAETKP